MERREKVFTPLQPEALGLQAGAEGDSSGVHRKPQPSGRFVTGFTVAALVGIVALGAVLHFSRLSYPAQPVFDERHFATYAADYAVGQAFFDIHPPLGKLIFASVLSFFPRASLHNAPFLVTKGINKETGEIEQVDRGSDYGDFPYVSLRAVSALFGIALPLAVYAFLRAIGVGTVGSLLGAALLTFENALLLETRLILMDGMYLALGFGALALYFSPPHQKMRCGSRRPRWAVAAGALWGAALGVKLTSVVFLGPLLVACLLHKEVEKIREEEKTLVTFVVAGAVVYLLLVATSGLFFTPQARIAVFESLGGAPPPAYLQGHGVAGYLWATGSDILSSVTDYTTGKIHVRPDESPWYLWPLMGMPRPLMTYYRSPPPDTGHVLALEGNQAIWHASTAAVLVALALLFCFLRRPNWEESEKLRPLFLLLGGYVAGLFPFATMVHRTTFLYHYFPALLFAVGLFAWLVERALRVRDFASLSRRGALVLLVILAVVVMRFAATAPLTFGT